MTKSEAGEVIRARSEVEMAAPAKSVLGTVHGAGNMLASLVRAFGPAIGGWVFSWGVDNGMIGAVWWFYLVPVAGLALLWCMIAQ